MQQKHFSTDTFNMCLGFMPWLAEFAVPNGTFIKQKVNFLYTLGIMRMNFYLAQWSAISEFAS